VYLHAFAELARRIFYSRKRRCHLPSTQKRADVLHLQKRNRRLWLSKLVMFNGSTFDLQFSAKLQSLESIEKVS